MPPTLLLWMSLLLCGCLLPDVTAREGHASEAATPAATSANAAARKSSGPDTDASTAAISGGSSSSQPASGPCQPACTHGVCKQAGAAFKCDCVGSGFTGEVCDEPDPCPNGKDCAHWRSPQRLETAYPYELQPSTAFGPDGSVLAYWNAPTKAAVGVDPNGTRWVKLENYQIAGVRYDPAAGWGKIEAASAVATVSCVALSGINAHGEALAAHVEVDDSGHGTLIARRASSAGWSDPVQVGSPTMGLGSPCAIAIDDRGNGLVAVRSESGVLAAHFLASDHWESPKPVPGLPADYLAAELVLRMQPSGDATLIAVGTHAVPGALIASTFSSSAGWLDDPLTLSTAGRELRVATNASGDAVVVWRVQRQLQSARFSGARGWGAVEQVAELGDFGERYGHDLAMNASGQAWLLFVKTTHSPLSSVWARPYSLETGWGTAVQVSDEFSQARIDVPGVAIDEAGNASATWRRDDFGAVSANQIAVNRFSVQAAAWLGPVVLSGQSDFPASAQVGFDAMSTPIAVWASRPDQMSSANVWLSRWE